MSWSSSSCGSSVKVLSHLKLKMLKKGWTKPKQLRLKVDLMLHLLRQKTEEARRSVLPAALLKNILRHGYFPVSFTRLFRPVFFCRTFPCDYFVKRNKFVKYFDRKNNRLGMCYEKIAVGCFIWNKIQFNFWK